MMEARHGDAGGRRSLAQVTDTIPVGGSRTIETDGLASVLATGWAEVLSAQSIGGTAIFRIRRWRRRLPYRCSRAGDPAPLPFDRGWTWVWQWRTRARRRTRALRGHCATTGSGDSADSLSCHARAHSFGLTNPSARPEDQRGVVEFSSGVEFFTLGIRGITARSRRYGR